MKLKKECDIKKLKKYCRSCGEPIDEDWLKHSSGDCRRCYTFFKKCDIEHQDITSDAEKCPMCGSKMKKLYQTKNGYKNWIMSQCPNCGHID